MMSKSGLWTLVLVLLPLVLAGCSKHQASGSGDALSQVVARVNGEEITVSQLNTELAAVPDNGEDAKAVQQDVLRAIVFRTLLRQAALEKKLDRKPEVHLLMDAARDKVLAQSYMDAVTGANRQPTAEQVAKYIDDHPLAFGERRIYHFLRLMMAVEKYSDKLQPMFDQKPQAQNFDQLEDYLKGQGIGYTLADVQLPSTDFPEQVQQRLSQFGVGDNVVVRGPQSIIILKIKGWTAIPVEQADAQRIASDALKQEAQTERAAALRTQMIKGAKIEFSGAFAGMSADEPQPAPAPQASVAPQAGELSPPQAGSPGEPQQAPLQTGDGAAPQTAAPAPGGNAPEEEGTVP